MKVRTIIYGWLLLLVLGISCEEPTEQLIIDEDVNPIDWTDLTHGNKVDPDYDAIFPQNRVNTLEIILGSANWQGIKTNMKDLFGYDFGSLSAPSNGIPASEPQYVP
ncbi:MAG TPA: hypothetical protein PLJ08_09065, partial [Cyclobacteriaceae bacterium]|nr:hypothetical protein [Cyclobacteriaceae bacterium]